MEFGLQFLSPAARLVSVQPTLAASTPKLCLLLADAADPSAIDALLTPPNTFSELREFEIEQDGAVSCVRARSLIEKTGRFELFHVSPS
jgi:cyclic-di-GMP-binding protein